MYVDTEATRELGLPPTVSRPGPQSQTQLRVSESLDLRLGSLPRRAASSASLELPVACPEECRERGGRRGDRGPLCSRRPPPRGFWFGVTATPRARLRVSARGPRCRSHPWARVCTPSNY